MKKPYLVLGLLALLCMSLPWSSSTAGDKAYPMVCRGGGNMSAMYGRAGGETVVSITFERSPYADNDRHPGPGQCAWLDRPLTPEEQLDLRYTSKKNKITNLKITKGKIEVLKVQGDEAGRKLKYLIDAIHNGQLFNLMAKRDKHPWGAPYLKITRVGP